MRRLDREDYFAGPDCAPKLQGRHCYGDCCDCFYSDFLDYERGIEHITKGSKQLTFDFNIPKRMMGRGRVID